ncbi:hypothetical protein FHR29_000412 [Sphingobacterium sp. JUb56]|nr:hypothetical protein [Sphingobacterium sp. JUb56]
MQICPKGEILLGHISLILIKTDLSEQTLKNSKVDLFQRL